MAAEVRYFVVLRSVNYYVMEPTTLYRMRTSQTEQHHERLVQGGTWVASDALPGRLFGDNDLDEVSAADAERVRVYLLARWDEAAAQESRASAHSDGSAG